MAGGIDWFRWHHGSVTDPKFALVARKAGVSLPDVLAVWAYLLEQASAAETRGEFGAIDAEAVDCLFGFADGATAAILTHMTARELIDGDSVSSWEKRQPKREDETANERKRRQREREHEIAVTSTVTTATSRDVTQGHADVTHGHARVEERREEEKEKEKEQDPPTPRKRGKAASGPGWELPDWVPAKEWEDFEACRARIRGVPFTDAARDGVVRKLAGLCDQGADAAELLEAAVTSGWRTVYAPKPNGHGPPACFVSKQEQIEAHNKRIGQEWLKSQEKRDAGH